jgi:hypothetical protein
MRTQHTVAFPLQQCLCECTGMLHFVYIAYVITSLATIVHFFLCHSNVLSAVQDYNPERPLQAHVYCISKISLGCDLFFISKCLGEKFQLHDVSCELCICNLILQCMCTPNLYVYRSCFFLIVWQCVCKAGYTWFRMNQKWSHCGAHMWTQISFT